jgi:hypothetical protein
MKKKQADPLKIPIDTGPLLTIAIKEWDKKGHKSGLYQELIDKEIDAKIPYLRVALGLHPNATDREIIVALAKQKYPGFCMGHEAPKKGAKVKWSGVNLERLYFEVQSVQGKKKNASIVDILDQLLNTLYWRKVLGISTNPTGQHRLNILERFRQRYYDASNTRSAQEYNRLSIRQKKTYLSEVLQGLRDVTDPSGLYDN